jgi:putative transposase
MKTSPDPHYRRRCPAEIISHAVWLSHVFSLSFRDVEPIMAERGVVVSYEDDPPLVLEIRPEFRTRPLSAASATGRQVAPR